MCRAAVDGGPRLSKRRERRYNALHVVVRRIVMVYFASYFALVFAVGLFVGFFVGYLYRGRPAAKRAIAAPSPATDAAPSSETVQRAAQEIEALPGMTPAAATALAGAGVTTLADLGSQSAERLGELARTLKLEDFVVTRWSRMAALQGLAGVDDNLAQALMRIGVPDPAGLASENPDRVQNKLSALHDAEGLPARVPTRADVEALIQAASAL